jgi:iron complex outermembrane receptor protein
MSVRAAGDFRLFLCAAAAVAWSASAAFAATALPPSGDAASGQLTASTAANANDSALAEIIVTARRKEENSQTVPVSVSVIDANTLAQQEIATTNDLQRLVPGTILNGAGSLSNSTYTIRGQGKSVTGPGLPSVITYVNEIPLPSIGSYAPLFDVQAVQVLKGPQGTLFGRNTTGGAVLVYSMPPSMEFGGYGQVDFGNFNKHSVQGAINLPIIDGKLAIRLAGDLEQRSGYTRNVTTGNNQDNTDLRSLRLSLLFQPTEQIKNVLVMDYNRSKTNALGFFPFEVINPQLNAAVAAQNALGNRTVQTSINPYDNETFWGAANTTTANVGHVTVKNIFGYRFIRVDNFENAVGLPTAPLPNLGPGLDALGYIPGQPGTLITTKNLSISEQLSDEMNVSGTAFDDKLSWIAGAFYLDERPAGQDYLTLDLFRPTPPSPTTAFIVNNFLGGVWPVGSMGNTLYGDTSKALYTSYSYDIGGLASWTKGIKLNAGYRYTWDRESVCSNALASVALATGLSIGPPYNSAASCQAGQATQYGPAPFSSYADFSAPTYSVGIDYSLNDDVFLYFTTRRGYRAGGLNTPTLAPSLAAYQNFQPQTITDYEVGTHTKWVAGDWIGRVNFDVFMSKLKQLQLQATGITAGSPIPGINANNAPSNSALEINAGTATSQGVELNGVLSPFRGLNFTFGAAYLNEHFDALTPPGILAPYFAGANFTGAPRWSYSAGVEYFLPVPTSAGAVALRADYYHLDEEYQGPVLLGAYSLTSLNVEYSKIAGTPLDVTLYVDNAFNTRYVQDVILSTPSFGVYTGNYAPPRMFGIRLRYAFGGG